MQLAYYILHEILNNLDFIYSALNFNIVNLKELLNIKKSYFSSMYNIYCDSYIVLTILSKCICILFYILILYKVMEGRIRYLYNSLSFKYL